MTYRTEKYNGAEVEVFTPCRIVRVKTEGREFKFFAQTEGISGVVIYIGHGKLDPQIKQAIQSWAIDEGIDHFKWGSDKEPDKKKNIA